MPTEHHAGWVDLLPHGDFDMATELQRFREMRDLVLPADAASAVDRATFELIETRFADLVVTVSEAAPPFTLPDVEGRDVSLDDLLKQGPVVLVFYRGAWCPYCNIHLRAMQQVLPEITGLGATLVAVSGQTPDESLSTVERNGVGYPVLSDVDLAVGRSYGLVFELPDYLREAYARLGHRMARLDGGDAQALPIPATFVIDTGAVVRYAYADPDYSNRADPTDVLAALRAIAG